MPADQAAHSRIWKTLGVDPAAHRLAARKLASYIATPPRRKLTKTDRPLASAPAAPRTGEAVFRRAVAAVPSPQSDASLADAFDAAKAKYHDDPRYGTPITGPAQPVGKTTSSASVPGDAVAGALSMLRRNGAAT